LTRRARSGRIGRDTRPLIRWRLRPPLHSGPEITTLTLPTRSGRIGGSRAGGESGNGRRRKTGRQRRPGRFAWLLRLAPLAALLTFGTSAQAAVTFSPGSGSELVSQQTTGIYNVVHVNRDGTSYTTLAFFNKGRVLDAHTQSPSGWLAKKSGNSPKPLSTSTFQQLIGIAGVNANVETLPAAKKNQFYQLAGSSGGSSSPSSPPPPEVPPGPGNKCPPGYQLHFNKPAGGVTCRLQGYSPDGASQWLVSLWNRLALIPRAEVAAPTVVLVHLGKFSVVNAGYMRDDAGQELYSFTLLGVTIKFFFGNTAG
jgi:hypothetical protein